MAQIFYIAEYRKLLLTHQAAKSRKTTFTPEQQGSLDGLCGIYSIVNAVAYIANLSSPEREELFSKLVNKLRSNIAHNILHGTSNNQLKMLLEVAKAWLDKKLNIKLSYSQLASSNRNMNRESYILQMRDFLQNKHSIVLTCLYGKHFHWTCIIAISKRRIKLLDSDGLKTLRIANCRIGKVHSNKHHYFRPTTSWRLTISL